MADFERESDIEAKDPSSSQLYIVLGGIVAIFLVAVIVPATLFVVLKSRQPAVTTAAAPVEQTVSTPAGGGSIAWEGSYESALETARQSNKPVMVEFYTDWCGVCKSMDAQTFPAPEVVAESQNFVNVRVNAESRTDLAQQYGVSGYPTFVFLDSNGNVRSSVAGGFSPANFAQQLRSSR